MTSSAAARRRDSATTSTFMSWSRPRVLLPGRGEELRRSEWPDNVIIVSTEQPSTTWFALARECLERAQAVWDIDHNTSKQLRRRGIAADYLPLGYAAELRGLRAGRGAAAALRHVLTGRGGPPVSGGGRPAPGAATRPALHRQRHPEAKGVPPLALHLPWRTSAPISTSPTRSGHAWRAGRRTWTRRPRSDCRNDPRSCSTSITAPTCTSSGTDRAPGTLAPDAGDQRAVAPPRSAPGSITSRPTSTRSARRYYLDDPRGRREAQEIADTGHETLVSECRLSRFLETLLKRHAASGARPRSLQSSPIEAGTAPPPDPSRRSVNPVPGALVASIANGGPGDQP